MSKKPSSYVGPDKCPYCGYKVDCATGLDKRKRPRPQDFSLCIKCAGINTYTKQLKLRKATAKQLAAFQGTQPREYLRMELARSIILSKSRNAVVTLDDGLFFSA